MDFAKGIDAFETKESDGFVEPFMKSGTRLSRFLDCPDLSESEMEKLLIT